MEDRVILKLAAETAAILGNMAFHEPCDEIRPSYNALLLAAQANHPTDTFLQALKPLKGDLDGVKNQMQILFTQLRIVMESLQEPGGEKGSIAPGEVAAAPRATQPFP